MAKKGKYERNNKLQYKGEALATFCRRTGTNYNQVYNKIIRGYTIEQAIDMIHNIHNQPTDTVIPCRYCKHTGVKILTVEDKDGDIFYAQCTHCHKWNPYEFPAITKRTAIQAWNYANSSQKGKVRTY